RTGPPAMTPVPGDAGRRNTTPAAASPVTGCGIVFWMRGTRKKFFLASSTPLAIAAGTSLALPYPTPTRPLPSPTTTSAVKLNRRPPLTTFATRLIFTTRSMYETPLSAAPPRRSSRRSRRSPPPPAPRRGAAAISGSSSRCSSHGPSLETHGPGPSEHQPAFTGAVGERRDAPCVAVATPVEHDLGDSGGLGPLSEELADLPRLLGLGALQAAQRGVHGGGAHQRVPLGVVHDLHEHVPGGPRDDQTRTLSRTEDLLADAAVSAGSRHDAGGRALAERNLASHAYLP